jgi:sigma-E factor negative regulatory protein RseA
MKTTEVNQEQISAFADGELEDPHIDEALALLRHPEHKADWATYHQIGDMLRSDDMPVRMSPGFSARLAARLEQEPAYLSPVAAGMKPGAAHADSEKDASAMTPVAPTRRFGKRWAFSGIAASFVAAIAFFTTPQLIVALKPASSDAKQESVELASTVGPAAGTVAGKSGVVAANAPAGVVMRDARIDDYLFAHQRFSPSVYSTTQYARPATFPTESSK